MVAVSPLLSVLVSVLDVVCPLSVYHRVGFMVCCGISLVESMVIHIYRSTSSTYDTAYARSYFLVSQESMVLGHCTIVLI